MPTRWTGWLTARQAGGKTMLYWRGSVMLTLTQEETLKFKGISDEFHIAPNEIARIALIDWLNRYEKGEVSIPLSRQKGPYLNRKP